MKSKMIKVGWKKDYFVNEMKSIKIKVGWKQDSFGKNTSDKTDVDTTGYKRKVYEEISNAMKIIVALMRGAQPMPEFAAPRRLSDGT